MMHIYRPPGTLFIELTVECNYHCRYCHMWTLTDAPDALTTEEKATVIREFARLSPNGEVVFTGGETMKKKEQFFSLVDQCRDLGLRSAANTNGSYISPSDYENVIRNGPRFLVFSLDSHIPSVHDLNRGVPDSFEATQATIAGILQKRRELHISSSTEIITNSVLLEDNIATLFEFLKFLTDLGVDGATFQILSPTFHRKGQRDVFYERHFFKDKPRAVDILQALIRRLEDFPIVRTTATDLKWMQHYILNPAELKEAVCGSYERNIMVDQRGDVQLCFNMRKIFNGEVLGNVRSTRLSDLWTGNRASASRDIMAKCRQACGMLNCHRKAS